MQRMAPNALAVILSGALCVGCTTSNAVKVTKPSIQYQTQDNPETQLECPDLPGTPNPETATDRQTAAYIVGLRRGYGTCYRSVKAYKAFRKGDSVNDADRI